MVFPAVDVDSKIQFAEAFYSLRDLEDAYRQVFPSWSPPPQSKDAWVCLSRARALMWDPVVRGRVKDLFDSGGEEYPEELERKKPRLSRRKAEFVDWFLESWNPAFAARRAGYVDPVGSGRDLLRDPDVLEEVGRRLQIDTPLYDEVLYRLRQMAFVGAGSFVTVGYDPTTGQKVPTIDWEMVQQMGWAVKKITPGAYGYAIETHDNLRALELLAKAVGVVGPDTTRHLVSAPDGGPVQVEARTVLPEPTPEQVLAAQMALRKALEASTSIEESEDVGSEGGESNILLLSPGGE